MLLVAISWDKTTLLPLLLFCGTRRHYWTSGFLSKLTCRVFVQENGAPSTCMSFSCLLACSSLLHAFSLHLLCMQVADDRVYVSIPEDQVKGPISRVPFSMSKEISAEVAPSRLASPKVLAFL